MTVSETSLTSSSSSAKSHATLPPDLPSSAHAPEESVTLPSSPLPLDQVLLIDSGGRRGSNFLLGRASVVGTGLSKSDPSFDFFHEEPRPSSVASPGGHRGGSSGGGGLFPLSPSLSSVGRRRKQSAWKKKLGEPGVALQARIVRDKATHVSLLTGRLQVLTEELAMTTATREEEEAKERQFVDVNLRIREELNDIFNHIQVLA